MKIKLLQSIMIKDRNYKYNEIAEIEKTLASSLIKNKLAIELKEKKTGKK